MDVFPSKVDTWFMFLFWGGAIVLGAAAPLLFKKSRFGGVVVGVVAFLFAGVSYTAQSLKYVVAADGILYVRGGLLPGGPLGEVAHIVKVEPSNDARSAPAASLDRLRVDVVGPAGKRSVLISPEDKGAFLEALVKRDPKLQRIGDMVVRPD